MQVMPDKAIPYDYYSPAAGAGPRRRRRESQRADEILDTMTRRSDPDAVVLRRPPDGSLFDDDQRLHLVNLQ
ncbi:MAG: hypothetical protein WKG07_20075 [Hymenobacter sp.]